MNAYLTASPSTPRQEETATSRPARVKKVRATFHMSEALFEELRDCVVALSGPPHRLTLTGFAEIALREKLEALKKTANKGKPFPKRDGDLKGGRPIGS